MKADYIHLAQSPKYFTLGCVCVCFWGSNPEPPGKEHQAIPQPLELKQPIQNWCSIEPLKNIKDKQAASVHTYNPSAKEVEAGKPLILRPA